MPEPWERPANIDAIRCLNAQFSLEERLAKSREEMLEAVLEITRELDDPTHQPNTVRPDTVAELAQVVVTLHSLLARPEFALVLRTAVANEYRRLRKRLEAGEFGPDGFDA